MNNDSDSIPVSDKATRAYCSPETKKLIKLHAVNSGMTMVEIVDDIVQSNIDKNGLRQAIPFCEEDIDNIRFLAELWGISIDEAAHLMISGIRALFDERTTVATIMKPISKEDADKPFAHMIKPLSVIIDQYNIERNGDNGEDF